MKIGLAQIGPKKGDINSNIKSHKELILLAVAKGVNAIFFPELSITGYEPDLADELKISPDDSRFTVFQNLSTENGITIAIGAPTKCDQGVKISMLIFRPEGNLKIYSKQILHNDEKPYFINGGQEITIISGENIIAPAICYESLQIEHLENSILKGANIYLASVAKSQKGMDKAEIYYSKVAKEKSIPILMVNGVGYCDNFKSVGQSTVWNRKGNIIGQLNQSEEGVLVYDSQTETTFKIEK